MRNFDKVRSTNFVGDNEICAVEIGIVARITHRCCHAWRVTRVYSSALTGLRIICWCCTQVSGLLEPVA